MKHVCDYCGHQGSAPDDRPVEEVQCPICGEPVTPVLASSIGR